MKVIACMAWYDERPEHLAAVVASAAAVCDHFIAVDGAYALYPDAKAASAPEQYDAIRNACEAHGLDWSIWTPSAPWAGNEVEKRAEMFRLALTIAEPNTDWLLLLDADTVVTQPVDRDAVRAELDATTLDVAEVTYWTRQEPETFDPLEPMDGDWLVQTATSRQAFRSLFRALPGLTVEGLHYVYTTVKGGRRIFLWHSPDRSDVTPVPALNLTGRLFIEHRNGARDKARNDAAQTYYDERTARSFERAHDYAGEVFGCH